MILSSRILDANNVNNDVFVLMSMLGRCEQDFTEPYPQLWCGRDVVSELGWFSVRLGQATQNDRRVSIFTIFVAWRCGVVVASLVSINEVNLR